MQRARNREEKGLGRSKSTFDAIFVPTVSQVALHGFLHYISKRLPPQTFSSLYKQ